MLPLKLVRSLVLGESINNHSLPSHDDHQHHSDSETSTSSGTNPSHAHHQFRRSKSKPRTRSKSKAPLLLFMPTRELITDTYRLATLARDIGLDLYPNPSLSHIIFSWPSSSPAASTSSSSYPSLWSSTSLSSSSSSSWSLPNDAVPLPFPSINNASLSHLRCFVSLTRGFFKLVFLSRSKVDPDDRICARASNWDCFPVSLMSRLSGDRIGSMEGFSRALAGSGWTMFRNHNKLSSCDSGNTRLYGSHSVYLFRKVDLNRVRTKQDAAAAGGPSGECRVRELRLPQLDFSNAPLRILQYILLMTDDVFYLA